MRDKILAQLYIIIGLPTAVVYFEQRTGAQFFDTKTTFSGRSKKKFLRTLTTYDVRHVRPMTYDLKKNFT